MRKDDHNKDSLSHNEQVGFNVVIGNIPNPIPNWLEVFFKQHTVFKSSDINDGIIEGYPIDDDF